MGSLSREANFPETCVPFGVENGEEHRGRREVNKWYDRKNGEFMEIDIPHLPCHRAKVSSFSSLVYPWSMHPLPAGPQNDDVPAVARRPTPPL